MSLQAGKIISEFDYKYGTTDYAVNLRKIYGNNGYQKYVAKMNSIMSKDKDLTNPIAESKKEYIAAKELQYKEALANLGKTRSIWNNYKNTYSTNLNNAIAQNGGISLNGSQKQNILRNSGDGAALAYNNFNDAQSEVDYALSLYNDATHSGMSYLS